MISQWIDFGVLERNRAEHGDGITRGEEEEEDDDEKKKKGQHAVGLVKTTALDYFSLCVVLLKFTQWDHLYFFFG